MPTSTISGGVCVRRTQESSLSLVPYSPGSTGFPGGMFTECEAMNAPGLAPRILAKAL